MISILNGGELEASSSRDMPGEGPNLNSEGGLLKGFGDVGVELEFELRYPDSREDSRLVPKVFGGGWR